MFHNNGYFSFNTGEHAALLLLLLLVLLLEFKHIFLLGHCPTHWTQLRDTCQPHKVLLLMGCFNFKPK